MEKLDQFYGLFIDGEFCESSDKARFKTYSPATGEVLAEVSEATREDVKPRGYFRMEGFCILEEAG